MQHFQISRVNTPEIGQHLWKWCPGELVFPITSINMNWVRMFWILFPWIIFFLVVMSAHFMNCLRHFLMKTTDSFSYGRGWVWRDRVDFDTGAGQRTSVLCQRFSRIHCEFLYDGFYSNNKSSMHQWLSLLEYSLANHNTLFFSKKYGEWLQEAIFHNETNAVVTLLKVGAKANSPLPNGYCPSNLALSRPKTDEGLMKLLIAHGADVNLVNSEGNTLLHLACAKGEFENIARLLRLGAIRVLKISNG